MSASRETPLVTHSPGETHALGERLGQEAVAGDVVALFGDLGAGKTVLAKGIAAGLDADPDDVTSPTFVLMRRHEGRLPLYHFDAYRLAGPNDMLDIGADEFLYGDGVSVIEWADRVSDALPPDRLEVHMRVAGERDREIRLFAVAARAKALLARVRRPG